MSRKKNQLERMRKMQSKLANLLAAAEELAQEIEYVIYKLTEEDLAQRPVANVFTWEAKPDGRYLIHIDGRKHVLSALRLDLLLVLAEAGGDAMPGDIAPWMALEDVLRKLNERIGHEMDSASLNTLVYRVRKNLGKDEAFVQSIPAKGLIRFAVKCWPGNGDVIAV